MPWETRSSSSAHLPPAIQQSGQAHCSTLQAESELKKLQQIYAVYAEHAGNVRGYAQLLWADLDFGKMVAGTQEVAKRLRGLQHLRLMPAFEAVEKEIMGFQSSLPLMQELRGEAVRKRHWDQLMAITGACLLRCVRGA